MQRTARTWGEIWHVGGVAKLIRDELLLDRDVADHKHVAWLYDEASLERTISDLMKLCSRQQAGTTSQQRSTLPVTGRGTIFPQGSKPRSTKCSPAGGHYIRSLPDGALPETH